MHDPITTGWLPIETAPKMVAQILGWCAREKMAVVIAWESYGGLSGGGCWDIAYPNTYDYDMPDITLWQLLPSPPKEDASNEQQS